MTNPRSNKQWQCKNQRRKEVGATGLATVFFHCVPNLYVPYSLGGVACPEWKGNTQHSSKWQLRGDTEFDSTTPEAFGFLCCFYKQEQGNRGRTMKARYLFSNLPSNIGNYNAICITSELDMTSHGTIIGHHWFRAFHQQSAINTGDVAKVNPRLVPRYVPIPIEFNGRPAACIRLLLGRFGKVCGGKSLISAAAQILGSHWGIGALNKGPIHWVYLPRLQVNMVFRCLDLGAKTPKKQFVWMDLKKWFKSVTDGRKVANGLKFVRFFSWKNWAFVSVVRLGLEVGLSLKSSSWSFGIQVFCFLALSTKWVQTIWMCGYTQHSKECFEKLFIKHRNITLYAQKFSPATPCMQPRSAGLLCWRQPVTP